MEMLTCQLMFPRHFLLSQTSICVSIKQLDYELKISIVYAPSSTITHRKQEQIYNLIALE